MKKAQQKEKMHLFLLFLILVGNIVALVFFFFLISADDVEFFFDLLKSLRFAPGCSYVHFSSRQGFKRIPQSPAVSFSIKRSPPPQREKSLSNLRRSLGKERGKPPPQ